MKKHIFTFQKKSKNTDIDEGIMHKCVNFQDEIRWNEGCAKTNRDFLTHNNIYPSRPWICLFCTGRVSTYSSWNCTHIHLTSLFTVHFFFHFLTKNFVFLFLKYQPPWRSRSKTPSSFSCPSNLVTFTWTIYLFFICCIRIIC